MLTVHHVPAAFSPNECDALIAIARNNAASDAKLVGQAQDYSMRRADLVWVDDVAGADWVMDRIIDLVRIANRDVFDFDIREFAESAQIARYGAERQGHFDWHSDIGEGQFASKRKLTMVVQLSEPDEYEGGLLELMPASNVLTAPKERGTATLFPAFYLHRVTPVTKGERFSLTIWSHGNPFR